MSRKNLLLTIYRRVNGSLRLICLSIPSTSLKKKKRGRLEIGLNPTYSFRFKNQCKYRGTRRSFSNSPNRLHVISREKSSVLGRHDFLSIVCPTGFSIQRTFSVLKTSSVLDTKNCIRWFWGWTLGFFDSYTFFRLPWFRKVRVSFVTGNCK